METTADARREVTSAVTPGVTPVTPRVAPGGTAEVAVRHGLDGLLETTSHHPFVRWEVTDDLADTWWRHEHAVAFQRVRRADRRTVNLLGADDGVTALLDALPGIAAVAAPARRALSVSVPQHLAPQLRERYRVLDGGDWEWLHTAAAPDEDNSHELVGPLDDVARSAEITAFLAAHSPTADTTPAHGERWFAIEGPDGSLSAVAAWGTTRAGAPHLSSVAVDTRLRGTGLGRTIVGALTRWAVAEAGVCTLGMYSHNTVARGLYLSLGYDRLCAWSSRPVLIDR
jgi:predicted GNAT family acetyltransferase